MALILDYRSYLYFLSLIKKPIFLGSNLLFPEGSFKFIMDKEIIFNMIEELSTELVSKITGIKTEYKLDEQEKKSFHELLSIQEENYNLNYAGLLGTENQNPKN